MAQLGDRADGLQGLDCVMQEPQGSNPASLLTSFFSRTARSALLIAVGHHGSRHGDVMYTTARLQNPKSASVRGFISMARRKHS